MSVIKKLFIEEEGQDMVEYGLVIALVVVVAATAYGSFGTNIASAITSLAGNISASL